LTERELRYIRANSKDFDDLDLSMLPTSEPNDCTNVARLFNQFIRLVDYTRLKHEFAGDTEDLIAIFEKAKIARIDQSDDLYKQIAETARRDQETLKEAAGVVRQILTSIALEKGQSAEGPYFTQEKDMGLLWEVLKLAGKLGVSAGDLARWATPTPNADLSNVNLIRDLRSTLKARYEPDRWQSIAQPIFDKLRKRQRDALVAYIMHQRSFDRVEQLFEYFLIDPGMEPVVQTSRLRLAISSVQLFIQRCLMNLEPKIHPSTINSKHWQWMKRYRIWEANRKIFLFPENWLEPEFRDDKTHLFQELESALLQGDVSNDLAEDAFFQYLKKLEELARLEIITFYCEEKSDPGSNILHVIGRTYNTPHHYFYRRYSHNMWTPWEPVTAEIEGDHVIAAVWRDRLHLFWLTFLETAKLLPKNWYVEGTAVADGYATANESPIVQMTYEDFQQKVTQTNINKTIEARLNWSEYYQGQWTTQKASGSNCIMTATRSANSVEFNKEDVFVHVYNCRNAFIGFMGMSLYTLVDASVADDGDPAICIHVGAPFNQAFQVVSKNSPPKIYPAERNLSMPYKLAMRETHADSDIGGLRVSSTKTNIASNSPNPKNILSQGSSYSITMQSNHPTTSKPEASALESEFFYQDREHTFFVRPRLARKPLHLYEGYVAKVKAAKMVDHYEEALKHVVIESKVPILKGQIDPDPGIVDPASIYKLKVSKDWTVNPTILLQFDGKLIGQKGRLELISKLSAAEMGLTGTEVTISQGSALMPGGIMVAVGSKGIEPGDVASYGGELHIIAGGGLNSMIMRRTEELRGSNLARGISGQLQTGR
jgi:hypothetical protein